VPRGGLEYVEHTVEMVANMVRHLFFGAVDEGMSSAAADAGVSKTASTRPNASSVAAIAALTEAGSLTSQIRVPTLRRSRHGCSGAFVLVGVAAPDRERCNPAAPVPARCQARCRHCRR